MQYVTEMLGEALSAITGLGGASSALHDPFSLDARSTPRGHHAERVYRDVEEVVRDLHGLATNAAGENTPERKHFLHNTMVSFYYCEFREAHPHVVRWVLRSSVLAEYIHHPQRSGTRAIGVWPGTLGEIRQYAENDIDMVVDEIMRLCVHFGMEIAENEESSEEEEEHLNGHASLDANRGSQLPGKEKGEESDGEEGEDALSEGIGRKIVTDDEEFAEQVFREALLTSYATHNVPEYDDMFYNMIWSFWYDPKFDSRVKLWWVFEKHVYSFMLHNFNPVTRRSTKYGTVFIYDDNTMTNAVNMIIERCCNAGFVLGGRGVSTE